MILCGLILNDIYFIIDLCDSEILIYIELQRSNYKFCIP